MGRAGKNNAVRVQRKVIAGIRVAFVFDLVRLDVEVTPDERDFAAAGTIGIIRLWTEVAAWAESLKVTNPGWTVGGERPELDPDDVPLDEFGE